MPVFAYTARAMNGELKSATMDAPSRDDVITQLRKQRLSVVKIEGGQGAKPARGKVKMRDLVIFTRQLSTMINAGLPVVQALDILAKQTASKPLAEKTRG